MARRRPPDRRKRPLPRGIRDVLDKDGYLISYMLRVSGVPARNVPADEGLERAEEVLADMRKAKKNGLWSDEFDPRMTVLEFCRFYVEYRARKARPSTIRGYESLIRAGIVGHAIADMRFNAVRSPHVDAWLADVERERGLKLSTVYRYRDVLASTYNLAIKLEFPNLVRNPVHGIEDLGDVPDREVVNLGVAQVLRLAEAMRYSRRGIRGGGIRMQEEPMLYALVIVMAGLGVRVSEALGLRRGDLRDWVGAQPWVSMASQLPSGARADIKTGATGHREIPVDDLVRDTLNWLMATRPPLTSDDPDYDGLIFHRRYRGDGPYAGNPLSGLRTAVERLHADDPTFPLLPPGTKTHILRYHFSGETLRRTGGDFAAVARAMGHADTSMLIETYLKTMPEWQDRIRRASQERWDSAAVDEGQKRSATGTTGATPIGFALDSGARKRRANRR